MKLGPGSPRLLLFFASWDQEVMDLKTHLEALNGYATQAKADGLPRLTAVDEGTVAGWAAAGGDPGAAPVAGPLTLPSPRRGEGGGGGRRRGRCCA